MTSSKITFSEVPFGTVQIRAGQLGYQKSTSIRLRTYQGKLAFRIKSGELYVQTTTNPKVFKLVKVKPQK